MHAYLPLLRASLCKASSELAPPVVIPNMGTDMNSSVPLLPVHLHVCGGTCLNGLPSFDWQFLSNFFFVLVFVVCFSPSPKDEVSIAPSARTWFCATLVPTPDSKVLKLL